MTVLDAMYGHPVLYGIAGVIVCLAGYGLYDIILKVINRAAKKDKA